MRVHPPFVDILTIASYCCVQTKLAESETAKLRQKQAKELAIIKDFP